MYISDSNAKATGLCRFISFNPAIIELINMHPRIACGTFTFAKHKKEIESDYVYII